ncbi:hypothetical protein VAPA_2c08350 [Variovorax paradoxus B4]|uniref:Uncharacterized protein n=1 Tax=Variovorax paradoxus B4 TaxID=1246301 RepID=T1XLG8_VARPD|nr:hypothetical protein VAPA_2c08350 [Variovorax paradoxus B4]
MHGGRRFNINIHICHRGDPVHKDSMAFMIEAQIRRASLKQ